VSTPVHLHPTADLAPRVLLPGDPGRALRLAQALLDEPKMFNHNRGLWGYTGRAADEEPLTIQSTGMGGPSAAIVGAELIDLGARLLLRVGTCGALDPDMQLGELLLATAALAADGTSRALGAAGQVPASPGIVARLRAAGAQREVVVASSDLFYDPRDHIAHDWAAAGAQAVEMECATLFALAQRSGVQAGAVLIVSDLIVPTRARIDVEALRDAEVRAGELAARALY
jgi:DeoD family purine-nucleoside phosphorylase